MTKIFFTIGSHNRDLGIILSSSGSKLRSTSFLKKCDWWDMLESLFNDFWDMLESLFNDLWDMLESLFNDFWDMLESLFNDCWDMLGCVLGYLGEVFG